MHEIMHTLGFFHEHTRIDRDSYIVVNTGNIVPRALPNFAKDETNGTKAATTQGIPYDYDSVMHYGAYAYAINANTKTITTKQTATIGQRTKLSTRDIARIKAAYPC